MSATNLTYKGTNKLLTGIVLSILTYWLFAQALVNIAPDVQSDLGLSASIFGIGLSLAGLCCGTFIVVAGTAADRFGRMKLTYLGLSLNIMGSLFLVITQGALLFIIGRMLQGLAAACIMPATISLVKSYYVGNDRQRAVSYWSIGSWGGSGFCSFFGGAVASNFGWRYVFIFSIIISVLSMGLIFGTPESKAEKTKKVPFDFVGLTIFIIFMLAFNIFISKGGDFGWTSLTTLMLLVVAIVGGYLFIRVELGNQDSFIDLSLFKNRYYLGATVSDFLLNSISGTMFVVNSYVQQGRGLSAAQSGLLSLGYLVLVLVSIRIGEKLLQVMGARKPMILGTVIAGMGVSCMSLTVLKGPIYLMFVFIGFSLLGIGLGLYATPSTDTAISSVPDEKVGVASGIYKMASSLGGGTGVVLSSTIYAHFSASGDYTSGATYGLLWNILFSILAVCSIVMIVPKETNQND
ncbi:MFS transporter [Vagococcus intermedius]|uniref:MFS transporter n=1 Tax=Vagococcus intermedius TaxID=2991418 RepID=A0AAF0IA05_9ENTE|nr:MFS transporter [Vagococcus intermedius]WEG73997.1 MFS transporter [Vagococcus intermedius]WEG76077.1 MFS transporter [Vagococcus intermedius]